jgi:hypothetical protein
VARIGLVNGVGQVGEKCIDVEHLNILNKACANRKTGIATDQRTDRCARRPSMKWT